LRSLEKLVSSTRHTNSSKSKPAWRAAMAQHMAHDDLEADQKFNEAIEDGGAPLLTLTILDDLLQRPGRSPGLTGPEFPFDV